MKPKWNYESGSSQIMSKSNHKAWHNLWSSSIDKVLEYKNYYTLNITMTDKLSMDGE